MTATGATAGSRALRAVVGRGALARPRQAAVAAAGILALAALALLLLVRPWDQGEAEVPTTRGSVPVSPAEITERLSRSAYGPGGSEVTVVLATRDYFRLTGQAALAARFMPGQNLLFFVLEHQHNAELGPPLRPALRVDSGDASPPARVATTLESAHHRFSVLVYPRAAAGEGHGGHAADRPGGPVSEEASHTLELVLPPAKPGGTRSVLSWAASAGPSSAASPASFRLTWATLLALFGGLLSSMWPCLFQLTVYFVPTLAGISASQGERGPQVAEQAALARIRIAKTAAAFVLGFVVVYTAAGAAAGFAAESLGSTSVFWNLRRPLSVGAGIVILLMAVRLAANGRAPLVCKMPLGNFLGRKRLGFLGTMILGVAFAIGCTTCFGAAIVLGMVTYVGIAGTPLSGALIMLVFSLGMAIPLMVGAVAMARVLNVLSRMERVAPYMILGASLVMAGFAVLLLSGHYMELSNFVAGGVVR